jgi:hypothetical protein
MGAGSKGDLFFILDYFTMQLSICLLLLPPPRVRVGDRARLTAAPGALAESPLNVHAIHSLINAFCNSCPFIF